MPKGAISVTLNRDNIAWLKGHVGRSGARSVSELLDRLITAARRQGTDGLSRSVAGTIVIDPADPQLARADAVVRELFDASLRRPLTVRERRSPYGRRTRNRG